MVHGDCSRAAAGDAVGSQRPSSGVIDWPLGGGGGGGGGEGCIAIQARCLHQNSTGLGELTTAKLSRRRVWAGVARTAADDLRGGGAHLARWTVSRAVRTPGSCSVTLALP